MMSIMTSTVDNLSKLNGLFDQIPLTHPIAPKGVRMNL